jgi:pSer/pThr/pTyr-binding forkhead associated (FHA) protein
VQSHLGRHYLFAKPQATIGCGQHNDIVLLSGRVSRCHGQVEQRGEEVFVVDLASTNGTSVNDEPKRVKVRRLNRGEHLSSSFQLHRQGQSDWLLENFRAASALIFIEDTHNCGRLPRRGR